VSEPRGSTVTLLFADIAGSTRLLAALGDDYPAVLADYRRPPRSAAR
jgi:class 3 adenylate cyclase